VKASCREELVKQEAMSVVRLVYRREKLKKAPRGLNFVSWTWKTTATDTFSLSVPFHTMLQTNHSAVTIHNWKLEI